MTDSVHEGGDCLISMKKGIDQIEKRCRARMMAPIQRVMPQISEWGGERSGQSVMLCPIDSMFNLSRQHGPYGLMTAYLYEGEPQLGTLFLPKHGETMVAERGRGTYYNDSKIKVIGRTELPDAIIRCDCFDQDERVGWIVDTLTENRVRWQNFDSPAEAFTALVTGKVEGYVSPCMDPSHIGGYLVMQEAGIIVTDSKGKDLDAESPNIVAARPGLHEQLLELIGRVL